jgi:integrase
VAEALNARTGERPSEPRPPVTRQPCGTFVSSSLWLAHQPGYKAQITYADADYFNLSDKDVAVARARREKRVPTLEQVRHVLAVMPAGTPLERRDRALVAFATITGARVGALASFRLGHVNLEEGCVDQDAREVQTKAAKTFRTYFMPVDEDARAIVTDWVRELERDHLWGASDPLFPATEMGFDESGAFVAKAFARRAWADSNPVRESLPPAFEARGCPTTTRTASATCWCATPCRSASRPSR